MKKRIAKDMALNYLKIKNFVNFLLRRKKNIINGFKNLLSFAF